MLTRLGHRGVPAVARQRGALRSVKLALLLCVAASLLVVPAGQASAHGRCNLTAGHTSSGSPPDWKAWGRLSCEYTHYQYQGQVLLQFKDAHGWHTVANSGDVSNCCYHSEFYFESPSWHPFPCGDGTNYRAFIPYVESVSSTGNIAHQTTKCSSNTWKLNC